MSSTTTNPATDPTPNPIATVTNNLGFDVDMYDVFNPDTSKQGPLTYKFLATVPNGASAQKVQTIRPYSQLQAMRTGNIKALNNNYYKQFPVALFVVTTFTPNAFTLTEDMQQSMEQSFKFIKFSQANPTSQLATDFRLALGDKSSQEDAVNKFFKGTGSFKLCTLSTWTAVFGWQTQFTSPWQGTYYLYSLGSSTAGSSSAPALVATLVITSSADDNSAVLTMANTDNENTEVVMAGNGAIQEKDPGVGDISLALAPAWLNVSQASQQDGKTVYKYVIGAAFTGTINGINVAGNLNQLSIPDPSDSSQNASDKNSANKLSIGSIASIVGMLTGTLGVAASIGMVYFMWKSHKQAEDQKKLDVLEGARNKADANTREREVEDIFQRDELPKVKTKTEKLEADVLPKVDDGYLVLSQAETTQSVLRDATNIEITPRERKAVLDNLKVDVKDADGKLETVLKVEVDLLPQEVVKSLEIAQDAAQKVEQQSEAKAKAEEELREQNKQEPNKEVDDGNFGNVEEQGDAEGGKTEGGKVAEITQASRPDPWSAQESNPLNSSELSLESPHGLENSSDVAFSENSVKSMQVFQALSSEFGDASGLNSQGFVDPIRS
ncbi:hypothetical protein FGADI_10795 [Fusarium gaditjirri]|uniref:Uncharacterized protein n=1 Tax=Fusarium gaditjirri TaxID=282569 RepID=A0A8H4SW69_9HYPO|nr:hypothetical protein FGADI_10795 [Fusarium gaditjirri]